MKTFKLNTGIEIPVIGSGTNTYGKENHDYLAAINNDTTEIRSAINAGYRHFDTAISYRNEAVVAKGIAESGLDRSDFFLTSKLPGEPAYTADEAVVRKGVEQSLKALNTTYIDLYLIHHPWDSLAEMLATWKVLEDHVDKGVLKAIGVSNFNQEQLGHLLTHARIKPAVNQIESHPGKWNDAIIDYSLKEGVIPEAWGPLSRVNDQAKESLTTIGNDYGKTWAQVILRYQVARGVIVIPKSHDKHRQELNLAIFDFNLTDDQQKIIAAL
ncbi:aldo/keto reductase [Vagococcus sp. BWB3-3]|uniref:Aldo/keto reductase n=1 Tax=Vagococcus allomyrinae TaxID=2794353 RepID=A0A940P7R8_9ENTE|nr:aldo/keto reductase [Vagococcus allomyrinae]MBP1039625.1 aldo/keto reductase [Vagococcus allomyrinae]